LKSSLPEDQLIEKIKDVHVVDIRSKTQMTAAVMRQAKNLFVIGCFCINTNQVDLGYAAQHGIAVFNPPFSNSRSIAELVISQVVALAKQYCERLMEMHKGTWNKVSAGCWESQRQDARYYRLRSYWEPAFRSGLNKQPTQAEWVRPGLGCC